MAPRKATSRTDFAVDAQYRDSTNQPATTHSSFRGSYTDTNAYPLLGEECEDPDPFTIGAVTCITDAQIRTQLETFISEHSLPKGMGTIYYLLTPPGVTVCLAAGGPTGHCSDHTHGIPETHTQEAAAEYESYRNSFCSYHAAITPEDPLTGSANTILYGVIPWTAGSEGANPNELSPVRPAYDCQDGGFDPSTEPPGEKEHANPQPRKEAEAKHRKELEESKQNCRTREKEVEGTEEEAEVQHNCELELVELESKYSKELAEITEKEELEKPHLQEPQAAIGELDLAGNYDQGLADVLVNQIAVEQQNIVTDPLLDAWHDSQGNEVTDECRNDFWSPSIGGSSGASKNTRAGSLTNETLHGNQYYINDVFLLGGLKLRYVGGGCQSFVDMDPSFTAPNAVNAGEIVGFDGMESAISLNWAGLSLTAPSQTYATYTWNFGDGTPTVSGLAPGAPPCSTPWAPPCAASVFHSYTYGGTYKVTLTVRDTGGNVNSVTHEVTVNGPAPPSPTPEGGGSGNTKTGTTGSAPSGQSAGASSAGSTVLPAPTATAGAASGSLKSALRRGLMIRYSVNEQVAGTIEVLLNASTAKKLHIRGPLAVGLPSGFPKSLVIGRAVLVTRKGGTGAIRLKFSKATSKALKRVHKLNLTLRVVVRNASRTNPLSTSLISSFVLSH